MSAPRAKVKDKVHAFNRVIDLTRQHKAFSVKSELSGIAEHAYEIGLTETTTKSLLQLHEPFIQNLLAEVQQAKIARTRPTRTNSSSAPPIAKEIHQSVDDVDTDLSLSSADESSKDPGDTGTWAESSNSLPTNSGAIPKSQAQSGESSSKGKEQEGDEDDGEEDSDDDKDSDEDEDDEESSEDSESSESSDSGPPSPSRTAHQNEIKRLAVADRIRLRLFEEQQRKLGHMDSDPDRTPSGSDSERERWEKIKRQQQISPTLNPADSPKDQPITATPKDTESETQNGAENSFKAPTKKVEKLESIVDSPPKPQVAPDPPSEKREGTKPIRKFSDGIKKLLHLKKTPSKSSQLEGMPRVKISSRTPKKIPEFLEEGYRWSCGMTGKIDVNQAVEYLRVASNGGNAPASILLARLLLSGANRINHQVEAEDLCSKAISTGLLEESFQTRVETHGSGHLQFAIGWLYESGTGTTRNLGRSYHWYSLAAAQGHADAQNMLGWMLQNGIFVSRDTSAAVEFYTKAAEQDHAQAQFNLGLIYSFGTADFAQDIRFGVSWYLKAASRNHARAQYNLAWMYSRGEGIKQSDQLAFQYLQLSAQNNLVKAAYYLGVWHEKGKGTDKDYAEALNWYIVAAKRGHQGAKDRLTCIYSELGLV